MTKLFHKQFILLIPAILLMGGLSLFGQVMPIQSVKNGNWSDPTVWSTGSVPGSNARIGILHRVTKTSNLTVDVGGEIAISAGGHLKVEGRVKVRGTLTNDDSLSCERLWNFGSLTNNRFILMQDCDDDDDKKADDEPCGDDDDRIMMDDDGDDDDDDGCTIYNKTGAVFTNPGTIYLHGYFLNCGTFNSTDGFVYMTGFLRNRGIVTADGGSYGYFDVCGSVKHHSGATVAGVNYLCIRCGGKYCKEAGRIGDFIESCGPFDVRLIDFYGNVTQDDKVHLQWRTASEKNSEWFIVERSVQEISTKCVVGRCEYSGGFEEIGRVKAAGTSTSIRSYEFTDLAPKSGANFYRLRMVDQDGNFETSPVVQVVVESAPMDLIAYPNPNNDILHLRVTGRTGVSATLTIYSVDGKRVWQKEMDMNTETEMQDIQVCNYSSGTYIVEFKQGTEKKTQKVIFQK